MIWYWLIRSHSMFLIYWTMQSVPWPRLNWQRKTGWYFVFYALLLCVASSGQYSFWQNYRPAVLSISRSGFIVVAWTFLLIWAKKCFCGSWRRSHWRNDSLVGSYKTANKAKELWDTQYFYPVTTGTKLLRSLFIKRFPEHCFSLDIVGQKRFAFHNQCNNYFFLIMYL